MKLNPLETLLARRTPGVMDVTREYAVLVPLIPQGDGRYTLLYEVRAAALAHQPGEICFPGGQLEGEETPAACALRETEEELAIPPAAIRVLGRLDVLAHRTGSLIHPILGVVDPAAAKALRPSPAEVAETFQVPVDWLLAQEPEEFSYPLRPAPGADFPYDRLGIPPDYPWVPGRERVPAYHWQDRIIWGITGRITRHFTALLRQSQQEERP